MQRYANITNPFMQSRIRTAGGEHSCTRERPRRRGVRAPTCRVECFAAVDEAVSYVHVPLQLAHVGLFRLVVKIRRQTGRCALCLSMAVPVDTSLRRDGLNRAGVASSIHRDSVGHAVNDRAAHFGVLNVCAGQAMHVPYSIQRKSLRSHCPCMCVFFETLPAPAAAHAPAAVPGPQAPQRPRDNPAQ